MSTKHLVKNNKHWQTERQVMNEFIIAEAEISARICGHEKLAKDIDKRAHQIRSARELRLKLDEDLVGLCNLKSDMEQWRKDPRSSLNFKNNLREEIDHILRVTKDGEQTSVLLDKSEKCGSKELERIAKEKGFWLKVVQLALPAALAESSAIITATSGQSQLLGIFGALIGTAAVAVSQISLLSYAYDTVSDVVKNGEYWCNDGPQRPRGKKCIFGAYRVVKESLKRKLHL